MRTIFVIATLMVALAALQASAYPAVRSRIVPAATRLPTVFTALVNRLAE